MRFFDEIAARIRRQVSPTQPVPAMRPPAREPGEEVGGRHLEELAERLNRPDARILNQPIA